MIYTCQHCGAFFPTEDLREAMKIKNNTMIKCTYCNRGTEFGAIRSSHIADGYRELGYGKFYRAEQAFAMAIQEARRHQKDASPDVYLGQALAQARVQTIFPDDDEYHLEKPELICHQYNEMEFSNSSLYLTAQELVPKTDEAESSRIASYAEYIDNVRDYYKKISASRAGKGDYSVFIAYEDDETNNKGYRCAQDIHTALPDEVFHNSFLPNIDNYKKGQGYKDEEKQEYEAEIMYALDHSKCMLVVVDDHTMGERDKISLIDKQSDREFYESRHNAILGSDYFKCIGGMGERSINSYWVTSSDRYYQKLPSNSKRLGNLYINLSDEYLLKEGEKLNN